MFEEEGTASLLGNMPKTSCQWTSGTTIKISLSKDFRVEVGDMLFLRDRTVYAHQEEGNLWSMAASGGISVGNPYPLSEPVIDVTFPKIIDLCSALKLDALGSYNHGGLPQWQWTFVSVACSGSDSSNEELTERIRQKLQLASMSKLGGTEENGMDAVEFDKDQLEPGCTYTIEVTLKSRWGKVSSKRITVTKKPIPAPQLFILGPDHRYERRSSVITLQAQAEKSQCGDTFAATQLLRFEWNAKLLRTNSFTGAQELRDVDLSQIVSRRTSASLVIPKAKLLPNMTYTFAVKVGFEDNWDDEDATTTESVKITVERSPIK
jgi:hypothetical protein